MTDAPYDAWMALCLDEARVAARRGEVPVGSLLVDPVDGAIVARAHNLRELLGDPTAHAELLAMRRAAWSRGSWRLDGLTLVVTLEPCAMCAGALVNARVTRLVYGCADPRAGAVDTMFGVGRDARLNHRVEVVAGVRGDECAEVLRAFFRGLRRRNAEQRQPRPLRVACAPATKPPPEDCMYLAQVQLFIKMLENLDRWLDKGVEHAKAKNFDPAVLLSARLAPDQYPLSRQVQAACDAAKFAAARSAGKDPPRHEDNEKTVDELHARIKTVVEYLKTYTAKDFDGADARVVPLPWMPGKGLRASEYFATMQTPNVFFHITTAYSILRHNGVALGKADYIGALDFVDV